MGDFGDGSGREQWEGTADPNAPSVANGQISPAQWAEYQAKRRRDMILGLLGVFGATTGLGAAGQAISAGAGGAASSAGSNALPAGFSTAPIASLPTSAAGGAAAAGGAGAAGSGLFAGLSARDLAALGLTGASTVGGLLSNKNTNTDPTTATSDPNLAKLMQSMQGRLDKSEPLYDSVLAMANGLLPTQYQKGGGGMR